MDWHTQPRRSCASRSSSGLPWRCSAPLRLWEAAALAAALCVLLGQGVAAQDRVPSELRTTEPAPYLRTTTSDENAQPALRGTQETNFETTTSRVDQAADYDRSTVGDGDSAEMSGANSMDLGPADALKPVEADLREQRDRDAFDNPPAGHNPGAFQIESVAPLQDRRIRQFFENDPFEQVGWRLGSFILFQELEVSPAWDSNVFFQSNARDDWSAAFRSETRLVSDWANHALELRTLHNRSYHATFSDENTAEQTYELRGRIDVRQRTTIEALVAHEVRQESRDSIDITTDLSAARPDVTTDRATLVFNHRFNRLSLQLRGGVSETRYEADERDVITDTLAARAQWEFRPELSVFGEVELNRRRRADSPSDNHLTRDSEGERYRAGVALGQEGEYLRGEASVGYGRQRPEAALLPDIRTFLIDANLAWRVTSLTSLLVQAATDIDETTLAGSPGAVNRSVGATLRHSFTPRLIGEAGVTYATQDYEGTSLIERSLSFRTNVEYTVNRHAALFSRFEHVQFRSSEAMRDYDANTVLFGVRLRN